jgi:hypothetical protein
VQTRLFNSDFYIAISFSSFFQDSWSPRKQTFDTTNLALEAIDVSSNCTEKKKKKEIQESSRNYFMHSSGPHSWGYWWT